MIINLLTYQEFLLTKNVIYPSLFMSVTATQWPK